MSLNHLIDSTVPLDQALDIKVKNIRVTGQVIQATSSLSYFGPINPSTVLSYTTAVIAGATVIPPTLCSMCQQTGRSFQVGYYVSVDMPAGVTSNTITLFCPYPEKLRTLLIENDPSVINGDKINSLGYTSTLDNTNHNKASLISSGPDSFNPLDKVRFTFTTDNGLPFTSSATYIFKIQHTQA
jgi:hypothetical protein